MVTVLRQLPHFLHSLSERPPLREAGKPAPGTLVCLVERSDARLASDFTWNWQVDEEQRETVSDEVLVSLFWLGFLTNLIILSLFIHLPLAFHGDLVLSFFNRSNSAARRTRYEVDSAAALQTIERTGFRAGSIQLNHLGRLDPGIQEPDAGPPKEPWEVGCVLV